MQPRKFNIVTDGQFGSCGKGLIASALSWKYRPQILSTTNLPNAGHSAVFTDGRTFVAKAIPSPSILSKWIPEYKPHIVIGATAAFCIDRLHEEIKECGINYNISIHPRAGVVTDEHRQAEAGDGINSTKHIASTMQGSGACMADKMMRRQGVKLARDYQELAGFMADHLPRKLSLPTAAQDSLVFLSLPEMLHRLMTQHDYTILHEGAQGFSLDINHGQSYPQCYDPGSIVTVRASDGATRTVRMADVVASPTTYTEIMDHDGWVKLEAAWDRETDAKLLTITCGHNVMVVTDNHPVIVVRNETKSEVLAGEVAVGDCVHMVIPARGVPNKSLPDSLAYSVGFFLGDGWIIGNHREKTHPVAGLAKARYARYRLRKKNCAIGTLTTFTPPARQKNSKNYCVKFSSDNFYYLPAHLATLGYGVSITPYETPNKANRLRVTSADFARDLHGLGLVSEGAANKRLPDDYMEYDDITLATILSGYIDSDGGVYRDRISFGVASLTICLQWQKWLHSIGVKCIIRHRKQYGDGFGTRAKNQINHWRMEIRFHSNHINHPVLERLISGSAKMARYRPSRTEWCINNNSRPRSAFYRGMSTVSKVEKVIGHRVCDFTTSSGTFIVNGILGHNCTSRGTTATQNMADMGISHRDLGDIYLVIRPYPIRVGNLIVDGQQLGYSGDCYEDQKEITWDQVAKEAGMPDDVAASLLKKELTTVTKRLRRVFTFSDRQLREAALINGVTKIALNFANYIDYAVSGVNSYEQLTPKVKDFIHHVEDITKLPVTVVGTGPQVDNVVFI